MTKFQKRLTGIKGAKKMKFMITLLIGVSLTFGTTLTVGSGQTYSTIQAGINAASPGDTVLVFPGTYTQNLNFNGKDIVVGSRFILSDSTSYVENTIINGNNNGSAVIFNHSETSSAVLSGFTIQNGYAFNGGGVYVQNASPTLSFLLVKSNNAYFTGAGLYFLNSTSSISNLTVTGNTAANNGGGIDKVNSTLAVSNSIFWNNTPNGISTNSFTVTYSDVESPVDSVYTGTGNINADPTFVNVTAGNYNLSGGSPCIDTANPASPNDLYGTPMDMGALYFSPTQGCMDPTAYNYDPGAYSDPGNICEYSPVASNVSVSGTEDNPAAINFSANDTNGGDVLTYSIYVQTSHGTVTIANPLSGTGSYTPTANYFGPDTLRYIVTDNSIYTLSDTAFAYISVTAINDAPVLTPIGDQTMVFNTPLVLTLSATDVDDLTEILEYTATTTSSFLTLALVANSLTITPTEFWGGTGDVTVTVTDASSATDSEVITVTHMPTGDFVTMSFGEIDYLNHVIPIMMDNPIPVAGFQFQVSPNIITVTNPSGGRAENVGWIDNITINNSIILGYMTTNLPPIPTYTPGDSALTFLSFAQGAWSGGPEICLQNVVLSDTLAQDLVAVIDTCVTYGAAWGSNISNDINQDSFVNVLDIVGIVDFVLGAAAPTAFQTWAGDSNEDGDIDVVDIVYIVQVILGVIVPRDGRLTEAEISFDKGQFMLHTMGTLAGMQLDYSGNLIITKNNLPEGWEIHQSSERLLIFNFGDNALQSDHLFDFIGNFTITSTLLTDWDGHTVSADITGIPLTFALEPAYPNPFNPRTRLQYSLMNDTVVKIMVFDILGNEIAVLANERQSAGEHAVIWDAYGFSSGMYFVHMITPEFSRTQKLLLLK